MLRAELLNRSTKLLAANGASSLADFRSFLDTTQELIASDSAELSSVASKLLRYLASDFPAKSFAPEVQLEIVKILSSAGNLSNEDFWLAYPATFRPSSTVSPERGCGFINAEIAKRAVQAIQDSTSTDKLFTQAVIVLRTLIDDGLQLTNIQRQQIEGPISRVLLTYSLNPSTAQDTVFELPLFSRYVGPVISFGEFENRSRTSVAIANQLIVTLNLIEVSGLEDELQAELRQLHEAMGELPLYGSNFNPALADLGKVSWSAIVGSMDTPNKNYLFERIIYLQSGLLLGKTLPDVLARFDEKRASDIAVAVENYLNDIASNAISRDTFQQLSEVANLDEYPRSVEVLEKRFTHTPQYGDLYGNLWVRAAGDGFFSSFTRALRNADDANRLRLLDFAFSGMEELECQDPEQLAELLAWCDEVMHAEPSDASEPLVAATARMLTGLLVENDSFSLESQRLIVDRLETYSQLDDRSFWLATPMQNSFVTIQPNASPLGSYTKIVASKRYAAPMRDAMIQHALNVLTNEVAVDEQLVCQALLVLCSAIQESVELPPEIVTKLELNFKGHLSSAAKDLVANSERVAVPSAFEALVQPEFEGGSIAFEPSQRNSSSRQPRLTEFANPVILILNLVLAPDLQEPLRPELELLYESVEKQNLMNVSRYALDSRTWQQQLKARIPIYPRSGLAHLVFADRGNAR